ncbi:hypothetical protein OTK49_02630 [Vibrio coralliirubri]|uniref:hypothetical protein n=1 Tax=Vibrio coralliirubri TaxID=1516159 RepID=UPI002284620A|nr:hypothetical protein [Vibrio coralliirubri]MCY9861413.1 hypothetical protein [Vibrio coralliirubri]
MSHFIFKKLFSDETIEVKSEQLVLLPESVVKAGEPLLVANIESQDFSIHCNEQVVAVVRGDHYVPILISFEQAVEFCDNHEEVYQTLPLMLAQSSNNWWLWGAEEYLDLCYDKTIKESQSWREEVTLDVMLSIYTNYNKSGEPEKVVKSVSVGINEGDGASYNVHFSLNDDGSINADETEFNENITRQMYDAHLAKDESFLSGVELLSAVAAKSAQWLADAKK